MKTPTVRPSRKVIEADRTSHDAAKGIKDLAPANDDYSLKNAQASRDAVDTALQTWAQAIAAVKAARDGVVAAEWEFHNSMLGLKDQVVAQYGDDSNEVQTVGLKRKSEYKPRPRKATNGTQKPQ